MELMRQFPDKHFELAIVDPPYGIGQSGSTNKTRGKLAVAKDYKPFAGCDISAPSADYWAELLRISKNQIVWGANHFISKIPFDSSCWIVWDKHMEAQDFADCELAWTSFKSAVHKFDFAWNGMIQGDMKKKENRIHPTQKPVALYRWLLHNYAKPGDKILDTHLGSGSIAIACHEKGFDLTGSELDADYFAAMQKRLETAMMQTTLL